MDAREFCSPPDEKFSCFLPPPPPGATTSVCPGPPPVLNCAREQLGCNGRWRQYRCHADAQYQTFLPVPCVHVLQPTLFHTSNTFLPTSTTAHTDTLVPSPVPHFPVPCQSFLPVPRCPQLQSPAHQTFLLHAFFAVHNFIVKVHHNASLAANLKIIWLLSDRRTPSDASLQYGFGHGLTL